MKEVLNEYNNLPKDIRESAPDNEQSISISAKKLNDAFQDNEVSANQNTETTVVQYTEDNGAEIIETNDDVTFQVEPENDLDQDNAVSFDMGEQSANLDHDSRLYRVQNRRLRDDGRRYDRYERYQLAGFHACRRKSPGSS